MTPSICPHLGLAGDRTLIRTGADARHRCYVQTPPASIDADHQLHFCLGGEHTQCPFYRPVAADPNLPPSTSNLQRGFQRWQLVYGALIVIALLVVAFVYGRALLKPVAPATGGTATVIPTATPLPAAAEVAPQPVAASTSAQFATPTPPAGGQVLSVSPQAGNVGWWSSKEGRGHLGDSFLYAGIGEEQVFLSAFALDLSRVPRGAPLQAATLTLTGLNDDRFDPKAGGVWTVSLLAPEAVNELARADFQTLLNAPAAITLVPTLNADQLGVNQTNTWDLDPAGRAWIDKQLLDGKTTVLIRLTGPSGGDPTLFAWDSGSGPATAGLPPKLVLSLGPLPATVPALPTQDVVVATISPTPANVLTVAVQALAATAMATKGTPQPLVFVTPTPLPENVSTVEAAAISLGMPPLVVPTGTPANDATATANAIYATAVALTTGTFTPVPTNAVTAIVVTPTPIPVDAAAAIAVLRTATAFAQQVGTPTALPYNVVVATVTATRVILNPSPTPENQATAVARVAEATLSALTTGTFTPIPGNAVTTTPSQTPTPVPLLLLNLQRESPTPTATPRPGGLPAALRGKILFFSDRPAPPFGEKTNLWALDPATGQLGYVTQLWPYQVAQDAERVYNAPETRFSLLVDEQVQPDQKQHLGVHVLAEEYNDRWQLSPPNGMSYDPAFSPNGTKVAFVSTDPGNDEIYVVNRDGSDQRRLTANNWEWDKHPSWSPNGSRIVFDSNRVTGRRQLWTMNPDGSNPLQLLDSAYSDFAPIWIK